VYPICRRQIAISALPEGWLADPREGEGFDVGWFTCFWGEGFPLLGPQAVDERWMKDERS